MMHFLVRWRGSKGNAKNKTTCKLGVFFFIAPPPDSKQGISVWSEGSGGVAGGKDQLNCPAPLLLLQPLLC